MAANKSDSHVKRDWLALSIAVLALLVSTAQAIVNNGLFYDYWTEPKYKVQQATELITETIRTDIFFVFNNSKNETNTNILKLEVFEGDQVTFLRQPRNGSIKFEPLKTPNNVTIGGIKTATIEVPSLFREEWFSVMVQSSIEDTKKLRGTMEDKGMFWILPAIKYAAHSKGFAEIEGNILETN